MGNRFHTIHTCVIPHNSRTLQKIQKLSLGCTTLSGRPTVHTCVIPHYYPHTLQKIQKLSFGCTSLSGRASHCIKLMLVTPSEAAVALAADEDDSAMSSLPEEEEEAGVPEG